MSELVARTGRHQQRYEAGRRLVAGCIPFKYTTCVDDVDVDVDVDVSSKKVVQVLMISSTSGPGLLFPKGGWENDETVEEAALREALEEAGVRGDIMSEGLCKAAMYALLVKEELDSWPEQSTRQRSWLTIPEAVESCRHPWMREALEEGFLKWHEDHMITTSENSSD
ncbi:hypothetical protein JRO89_XSUnG0090100 [Xanthoceras sorbifolium]|uniref:Nudix hydrolase domain-containing protein n=1 Tax=Xanthoceras sorbifolium TaxID=99658 RepID=A0ABQ8GYU9_9ROSI|nr:hypothetical protein JRO89_XSUnG0090100 [Xanthoceras sorbifolium]